jgi:hypothetical protein
MRVVAPHIGENIDKEERETDNTLETGHAKPYTPAPAKAEEGPRNKPDTPVTAIPAPIADISNCARTTC